MAFALGELNVGDVVASADYQLTRESLVRYAGASGDFNPIHYRDDVAAAVGLPGVLAHGMLTMGIAIQPVIQWCGDSWRLRSYQVRFTKPVVVDPRDGATLSVSVAVGDINVSETSGTSSVRLDLTVTSGSGEKVLGKAQAVVSPK